MPVVTVLAVDPTQTVLSFVRRSLSRAGYRFLGARSGTDAMRRAREAPPDTVVLRADLPDMSARELVSRWREDADAVRSGLGAPILLTAERGQEAEVAACLDLGAMSVIFFPFHEQELAARVDSLLRWTRRPSHEGVLRVGPVCVDLERGELLRPQARSLTASELEVLRSLLSPPGRAVTRRQIPVGTERAVDVHVASLRSKLGEAGGCIETIRGIGYRFRVASSPG
jgi:two-component system phosphate regulon response regulator PhoB